MSSSVILPDRCLESEQSRVWVIAAVSNPAQWKSRYALYNQFRKHITEELHVNLCTIECALGSGGFHSVPDDDKDAAAVLRTDPKNPKVKTLSGTPHGSGSKKIS